MGLCQGFLVAHPPARAILKVGHAGDEAAVRLTPKYFYRVFIFCSRTAQSPFPRNPLWVALTLINIGRSRRRQDQNDEKLES